MVADWALPGKRRGRRPRQTQGERDIDAEFNVCLEGIKGLKTKEKLKQVSASIKQAETEKDSKKLKKLIEEFNELTKKLKN